MVNEPVVTVFAIDEPEIVPINAEEKIATLAGPPEYHLLWSRGKDCAPWAAGPPH